MSLTLADVWGRSDTEINDVLKAVGQNLTNNPNLNRVILLILYHNKGKLAPADTRIVQLSNFTEIMSEAKSLNHGLANMLRPLVYKLLELSALNTAAIEIATTVATDLTVTNTENIGNQAVIHDLAPYYVGFLNETAGTIFMRMMGDEVSDDVIDEVADIGRAFAKTLIPTVTLTIQNMTSHRADIVNEAIAEGATDSFVNLVVQEAWRALLINADKLNVDTITAVPKVIDIGLSLSALFRVDLNEVASLGQGYQLLLLGEILQVAPDAAELLPLWLKLAQRYGGNIFSAVMTAEGVQRQPTYDEMVTRILALP